MTGARLIVNGDDFGMSRGVTDGIVLAHRYGVLTSTSLMANMPAAAYALSRLHDVPALGVGIHLNICAGRPILPPGEVPTLVDASGDFHPPAVMIRKLCTWRAAACEIEAEFRAQIRWMKDRGVSPTHADSHHHMHIYPAAALPFVRALETGGIPCARAPRCSIWPKTARIGGPHEGALVRRAVVQGYRAGLQRAVFRQLTMPDSRISFLSRDRRDFAALADRWKAAIAHLPGRTFELACHPGLFERGFSEMDAIRGQREAELQWLTDPGMRDIIEQSGVRLINYADLADASPAQAAVAEAPALQ